MKVTIVHQQGSGTVEGFEQIEEIDVQRQTLRVLYDEPGPERVPIHTEDGVYFREDYHNARITKVETEQDDEGGSGFITVDGG